ncbi:CAP domain-containing protein [Planctomyces sp. SH-PL62]|uniref:CAP domain-containing protein n=1 Tax=Planctomyces sp. SH-PL62 TaxID=1636152 RepID=UPI00078BEF49|nr:CAP domain-containing protein [Planctomyces sp. SH-PL62]AMV36986.1 Cysteine-rich secretory protein family protein [Planctomyces sp. SH-PL62]
MRSAASAWLAAGIVLFAIEPVVAAAFDEPAAPPTLQALLDGHNKERAAEKLPALALDEKLNEAARLHAADMAEHGEMTHEGSDGSTPSERVRRVGYHYQRTGENVAKWQDDVPAVMAAWMESPGHKQNILGEFTQMGAARVDDEDGRSYWCVEFGTPLPRLDPDDAEKDALSRINDARKEAGKEPLRLDPKLAAIARKLAEASAATAARAAEAEKAEDPDAKKEEPKPEEAPDLVALMKESGLSFKNLAQSVAIGEPTAEEYVRFLLGDEGRKELVTGAFGTAGIGYARDAEDRPSWCLLLVEE